MDVKSFNIKRSFLSGCGRRRNRTVALKTLSMCSPLNIPTRSTQAANTKLCVLKNAKSEELSLKPPFRSGNHCNLGKTESVSEHCGSDLFLKYHSWPPSALSVSSSQMTAAPLLAVANCSRTRLHQKTVRQQKVVEAFSNVISCSMLFN